MRRLNISLCAVVQFWQFLGVKIKIDPMPRKPIWHLGGLGVGLGGPFDARGAKHRVRRSAASAATYAAPDCSRPRAAAGPSRRRGLCTSEPCAVGNRLCTQRCWIAGGARRCVVLLDHDGGERQPGYATRRSCICPPGSPAATSRHQASPSTPPPTRRDGRPSAAADTRVPTDTASPRRPATPP